MIDIDDLSGLNESIEEPLLDGPDVAQTDESSKDGQNKCEKCGATDIALNPNTGNLRCNYCRHEQEAAKAEKLVTDISQLKGQVIGSGAQDIIADVNDVLTFKCTSCGAEVVIDTNEALQARCHWCRNTLSVNEQIPNGAVPDKVLPFSVKKADAMAEIEKFVGKRRFFALSKFNKEFTSENIMGVYLPYMVIDINAHVDFKGEAEHVVRTYTVVEGENRHELYDADIYSVRREFELHVEGMTIEANFEKLQHRSSERTNNIVNAIKPFDTENSVAWDANYMAGFTSQKRDVSVDDLSELVKEKAKSIALYNARGALTNETLDVKWQQENVTFVGKQWKAAYLPVWLYSYQQKKSNGKKMIHYVAVNGRNMKTMGSVPVDTAKLIWFSLLAAIVFAVLISFVERDFLPLTLLVPPVFFYGMRSTYRNSHVRHLYVAGTDSKIDNLKQTDTLIKRMEGLTRRTVSSTVNQGDRSSSSNNRGANRTAAVSTASRASGSNSVAEGSNRAAQAKETKRTMANQTTSNATTRTADRSQIAAKQAKANATRNSTSSNATTKGQGTAAASTRTSATTRSSSSSSRSSSSNSRSSSSSSSSSQNRRR